MGRRAKLTAEVQRRIVQAIKLGATYDLASQYAGIDRSTFYNWMAAGREKRSPSKRDFFDAVKEAEGGHALQALATIHRAAKDGDWKAGAWLIERRHGYTRDGAASRKAEPAQVATPIDPLQQIEKARADAFASGSYVAGAALLREEGRMRAEREQAEAERLAADRQDVPAVGLGGELADMIRALPDGARTLLLEQVNG